MYNRKAVQAQAWKRIPEELHRRASALSKKLMRVAPPPDPTDGGTASGRGRSPDGQKR